MPLPTSKKEMRFLWSQKPDIAQNKANEMKAAGKSIKALPTYAPKATGGKHMFGKLHKLLGGK